MVLKYHSDCQHSIFGKNLQIQKYKTKRNLNISTAIQPELKNKIDYDKIERLKKISPVLHYKCISQRY